MDMTLLSTIVGVIMTTFLSVVGYLITTLLNRVTRLEESEHNELVERARTKGEIMTLLREIQISMATKEDISQSNIRLSIIETKLKDL